MLLTAAAVTFPVDLIVLDKDGTMFELDTLWGHRAAAWEDAIEAASGVPGIGLKIAERIGHNRDTGEIVPGSVLAAGTMRQLREAFSAELALYGADESVVAALVTPAGGQLTPKGDIAAWMRRARRFEASIAVLTSDDRAPTIADLASARVGDLVDHVIGGDDSYRPKPSGGGLLAICDHFSVEPSRCVMVGDSSSDMAAAIAAGTRGIGISMGSGDAPEGAEAVVSRLEEIGLAPEDDC